jgi:hypothetical protein
MMLNQEIDRILNEKVCVPLTEVQLQMYRNDGPFMPLTITVYRQIAFKYFKMLVFSKFKASQLPNYPIACNLTDLDQITASFCTKLDREILD